MEYRPLGKTDLHVSALCLGTMTWGTQNTKNDAFEQMDYADSQGVNFFDTAELYPIPPDQHTQGTTEEYIGQWLTQKKCRSRMIIASKISSSCVSYIRPKNQLNEDNIVASVDAILKRLHTDYLDLFYLHFPERPVNNFGRLNFDSTASYDQTPSLESTLRGLEKIVRTGKVRYIGVSNETPWGLATFLKLSEIYGLPRMEALQNPYNLLNRLYDHALSECCLREGVSLCAYSPLAGGVLTGKYRNNVRPEKSRFSLFPERYPQYLNPSALQVAAQYEDIARLSGLNCTQMALSFVTSHPNITSNIIGATTLEQLITNLSSIHVKIPPAVREAIENVNFRHANPAIIPPQGYSILDENCNE